MKTLRIKHGELLNYSSKEEAKLFTDITLRNHGFDLKKEILWWHDELSHEVVYEQEED